MTLDGDSSRPADIRFSASSDQPEYLRQIITCDSLPILIFHDHAATNSEQAETNCPLVLLHPSIALVTPSMSVVDELDLSKHHMAKCLG